MAKFEPRPGSFTLFKNDRKEAETHADYRGDGLDLEGRPVWVNAWVKEGKNGKFFACSFKLKETTKKPEDKKPASDFDNDLPF